MRQAAAWPLASLGRRLQRQKVDTHGGSSNKETKMPITQPLPMRMPRVAATARIGP
jgi:hypothetical protein